MDTLSKLKLITKIIREARDDLALDNLRAFAKEKLRESEKWCKNLHVDGDENANND